jgi:hypothetical protein
MFKLTKLITLMRDAGEIERGHLTAALNGAIRATPQVVQGLIGPTQPGCVNGGDLIWHVQFHDERAYREAVLQPSWRSAENLLNVDNVAHVDSIAYARESFAIRDPGITNGIYRVLLLRLRPAMASQKVRQFEREMREMAHYIAAIRNWGFSRVIVGSGLRGWDYVWEQELIDSNALAGSYMDHPYHFAWIDRWFDPESHDWLLDTQLCHSFCPLAGSVLTPPSSPQAKRTT